MRGVMRRHTAPKRILSIAMPFPPDGARQREVVENLDGISLQTRLLETIYRQKLNSLIELKQAILEKAFAGEFTAQPEKNLQRVFA